MSLSNAELVEGIRAALAQGANPVRAAGQQRYMKSEMPFRGLTSREVKSAIRPLLRAYAPLNRAEWGQCVTRLYDDAAYREERYAALQVVRHRAAKGWLDAEALPLLRHLIVTGAWWDLADEVSTHPLRDALLADRGHVDPVLREWAWDGDLWLRRASVLSQIGAKERTDVALLRHVIEANVGDTSFWLRKAIGWALRDFAKPTRGGFGPRPLG